MNMFDPARPRAVGGRPEFLGSVKAVLPGLIIFPIEAAKANAKPENEDKPHPYWISIMVIIPTSWNGFSPKWRDFNRENLSYILDEYEYDPEGTLTKYWGLDQSVLTSTKPIEGRKQIYSRPKIDISLEDLDL